MMILIVTVNIFWQKSVTGVADQGELDEVEGLSTPTTQTNYVKSTPEGSRTIQI